MPSIFTFIMKHTVFIYTVYIQYNLITIDILLFQVMMNDWYSINYKLRKVQLKALHAVLIQL
jgi:hypothetical protein